MNSIDTNNAAASNRRRNRLILLGIVSLFVGPMLFAVALNLSGWRPAGSKAYGTLVDPPRDIGAVRVALADGSAYVWRNPQWQWTLLALPGSSCADKCRASLADVLRMRATLGRNAERLRVLYVGAPLAPDTLAQLVPLQPGTDAAAALDAWRAHGEDTLALALVDPGGLLMMTYAPGFDVGGVRRDLPKVIN
jgi:hypothetical protein